MVWLARRANHLETRCPDLPSLKLLLPVILLPAALATPQPAQRPGPLGEGVTLLPNGWRIAPAGSHLDAGDLPLAMALHPDGRHLVITNNGWSKPSLRVVDLERRQVIQKLSLDHAWLGLAWHPDGKRLFSSGAADNSIREVDWRGSKLVPGRTLVVAPPQTTKDERLMNAGFMGGLAVSGDGRVLYAAQVYGKAAVAIDLVTGAVLARRELPAEAYTTLLAPEGRALYVSVWGGARVAVLDPATLAPLAEIPVGEHPNAMALLQGRAASLRGLRQHQRRLGRSTSPPGRSSERIGDRALAEGSRRARRRTRSPSRRTAPRCSSRTPTTTPSPSSTSPARARAASRASSPPAGTPPGSRTTRRARTCWCSAARA